VTDRLSFSHGTVSTSFYLEADEISHDPVANTSVVRCYLRCINNGNTSSFSNSTGNHEGFLNGTLFQNHTSNPFLPSGYATGATRWRDGAYDITVAHASDGTGSFTVRQYVTDSVATNDQTSGSIALTTSVQVPGAPTSVTVTRVSDTQQTVAWSTHATAIAPYTSQSVQRRLNGGSWATIAASLTGSATSFSDTTTVVNGKYEYQVVATNSAGSTTSSVSAAIFTTPAAPTGAAAVKDGSGNIVITWTNNVAYTEYSSEVWESQNGGAYALLTTVSAGTATYTHTAPLTSVTHQYEVRAKTSTGTTFYSSYSVTGTVVLSTNPNAPASLAPNGVAQDASAAVPFTWVHSSADTSPQSQFQIEHRLTGNAWTTVTAVTSTVSSWSLPAGTYANGHTVEWHVRTWGTIGPGPYSATASFVTSTPPTATISSPAAGATLTTSSVAVAWAYYDAEGTTQAAWTADLLDGTGAVLETRAASNAATSATFATALTNSTSYSVRVKVQDGSGLWSTYNTHAFTTAFLPPVNVTVTPSYDTGFGWVVLTLVADAVVGGVTVAATSVDMQRSLDGGLTWVQFATGVDPNAVLVDSRATINGTNEYQAVVHSALPSSRITTPVTYVTTEVKWAYLSSGAGFGTVTRLFANLTLDPTFGRTRALYQFAGRSLPVEYDGEFLTETLNVTALLDMSENTFAEFRTQAQAGGTVLWRDPTGRRLFGAISPIGGTQAVAQIGGVSFTVTKTDYTE
jgi:hypothetical protein